MPHPYVSYVPYSLHMNTSKFHTFIPQVSQTPRSLDMESQLGAREKEDE